MPADQVPPTPARRLGAGLVLALPFFAALLVHAPSLWHGFMADDFTILLANRQITGGATLSDLVASDWFDSGDRGRIGYYRPVVKVSFRATYALFGPSPAAFHAGNLLLHAVSALLLAFVARHLLGDAGALGAALLFAVHPMTVEAVDVVTARSDLLAALFALAAAAALVKWADTKKPVWLALTAASAFLAFGSKESALLLPGILAFLALALDLAPARIGLALAPVVGAEAVFLLLRRLFAHVAPAANALGALGATGRALCVLKAAGAYLVPLVTGHAVVRLPSVPASAADPGVLAGLAVVLSAAALVLSSPRSPHAFAIALTGLSLAPALAVWLVHVPMWKGEIPMAERWLYLPSAGACLLAAMVLSRLTPRIAALLTGVLLLAFTLTTWNRTKAYASNEAYYAAVGEVFESADPRSLNPRERYLATVFRGLRLVSEGAPEKGLQELRAASALEPWLPDPLWDIARLELQLGRPAEAARVLERLLSREFAESEEGRKRRVEIENDTLQRMPKPALHHMLGRAYAGEGRHEDAAREFAAAARLSKGTPEEAGYLVDEARAFEDVGRIPEAAAALEEALRLRPGLPLAKERLEKLRAAPSASPTPASR